MTLLDRMLADGATLAYRFDEASGATLNYGPGGSAYDLTVDAEVTRGVAGISGPDQLAMTCVQLFDGTSPTWGHIEGTRPGLNGNLAFSLEAVLKAPLNLNNGTAVHFNNGLGGTAFEFHINSNILKIGLGVTGSAFTNANLAASVVDSALTHLVATWDGTNLIGYLSGANVFTLAIGSGGNGLFQSGAGGTLAVGGFGGTNVANIALTMDVLAVYYSHVLTPAEVGVHYAGLAGGGSPLLRRGMHRAAGSRSPQFSP
jgi:Concanavalin A-like lectin/glucanases superfamily